MFLITCSLGEMGDSFHRDGSFCCKISKVLMQLLEIK